MVEHIRTPVAYVNGTAADCRSPVTCALIDYWRSKRPVTGTLPYWSDLDLMDMYKIAANLVVKDIIDDGKDFRNRYWGRRVTEALGFEGTGMLVSSYEPPGMREAVQKRYRHIAATGETSMARGSLSQMPGLDHVSFELVHLPLLGADGNIGNIISAYHFGFVWPDDDGELQQPA